MNPAFLQLVYIFDEAELRRRTQGSKGKKCQKKTPFDIPVPCERMRRMDFSPNDSVPGLASASMHLFERRVRLNTPGKT